MHQFIDSPMWLLHILTKAPLFLAIVCLGSLLMRNRSAAAQHRWWTLGFLGCLMIPFLSLVAPTWNVPVVPSLMQQGVETTHSALPQTETTTLNSLTRPLVGQRALSALPPGNTLRVPQLQESERVITTPSAQSPAAVATDITPVADQLPRFEFSWSRFFVACWGIGVIVVLMRSLRQHWLLNRMLGRCKKLEDVEWAELLNETSRTVNVHRKVELLDCSEALSPVTAGVFRPIVIVPKDARNWSLDQRRLVLLHELAHVARRDVLAQTLASVACCLQWFNPLSWYGLRQMRRLRELACDDLVLSCGQQPTGYADVLLDIARSYRHQAYATAIGMTHNNDVESRILAILDRTRRHIALSRSGARMLFAFTTALVCLVGTAQFRTRAEPPTTKVEQKKSDAKPAEELGNEDLRTMQIRILDEAGEPLEAAMLRVGVWYPEGYDGQRTPKQHTTDAEGLIQLRLPKRLDILRLWPKQPGYVGQFKNFGRGTHRDGELIPDEYEFRLEKGHPIGGRIVDDEGKPVEGVHVRVKVDNAPGASTWLTDSFGQPTVKTDAEGRWQLGNAPAPREKGDECVFEVKLSHDDYVTDKYWGDSQRAQGIGTAELRRGDAELVLHRGTSVHGTVVDQEGKPITKGWVVWSDEPYFSDGVFEDELGEDGSFRTPPLPEKEFPITIVAPGFAAQRRLIKVGSDRAEQTFKLRPGKQITMRFVDTAGAPIPKVHVGLANSSSPDTWQNSNALHNHIHPNVPDYGVPQSANEKGVFVWDWAPEEPVRYSVWAKGFASKEVALVAKSEPHVITLAGSRIVEGLVTDANTGEPVSEFEAMPVIVFRPNFFSTRHSDLKQGIDGRYELPLTGSGDPTDRYRVRFEAKGYRSIVSQESFGPLDGRVNLDVQLEPAPMRQGRAIDPSGKPVANANIIVGTPTWVPHTRNGDSRGYGERVLHTDSEGRFALNATSEPERLRVFDATGIAEKLLQPNDLIGELRLQPWAKVSGRLMQAGKPIGSQTVFYNQQVDRGLGEARFQDSYSTQTKPDGTFAFDRIPPGLGSLRPYLGPWRDSPLTSAESLPLQLKAGETRELVLGGDGGVLAGQVVPTGRDEVPLDRNYSLNYLVSRDRSVSEIAPDFPALSFDPAAPMELSWSLDPHFNDWLATRENHFVKLTPEGVLRVTGVAPGDYDLLIRLYEQPAGCLVETVGEKIVPVRVEGDGQIDLGRIEVPCRAGPRPGSDMRAFSFVDSTGKQQSLNDMAGRHVLMHVWASWCAPCMASMPDIQHTADELASKSVAFVGLNIDEDTTQASELAKQMDWNWSQNYLGEDSAMARQLAISSVPTYYLIGLDGKLVASANEWTDIKKQLRDSLGVSATAND